MKSNKKKRSSRAYWICLLIFGILLAVGAAAGLKLVWTYADEYEASRPENTMKQYVESLSENLWGDGIADTVTAMPHEVQSDEEVAEHVKELLSSGIKYYTAAGSNANQKRYSLRCNGNEFGVVTLEEDQSYADKVKFTTMPWKSDDGSGDNRKMLPWKVVEEEFNFDGLYSSVEAVVPEAYGVFLNGVKLGSEYIVEEGIHYDVLEPYYAKFASLPTKVRYKFDHVIGNIEPEIRDEEGNVVEIDETRDDSQFIKDCNEQQLARLSQFAAGFVVNYLGYTSGALDPMYGYQTLQPYLVEGSDIDNRMKDAMDGLSWAHASSVKVTDSMLNGALSLGNGYYICDISATVNTYTVGKGEVETQTNMRVIVHDDGDSVKAVSLELY